MLACSRLPPRAVAPGGLDRQVSQEDLERENATLKRLLADAELGKVALKEIARGNF